MILHKLMVDFKFFIVYHGVCINTQKQVHIVSKGVAQYKTYKETTRECLRYTVASNHANIVS